jgi:phage-related protein
MPRIEMNNKRLARNRQAFFCFPHVPGVTAKDREYGLFWREEGYYKDGNGLIDSRSKRANGTRMAEGKVDDKPKRKRAAFLHGEIKTPPFSEEARKEAGDLLSDLQDGKSPVYPLAEKLPIIGPRCGALRVRDAQHNWRIMYRVDAEEVLIVDVYDKKTEKIPDQVIDRCKKRLKRYDETGEA